MSRIDREIDDYYFEYVLTGPRPQRARLESVDELYEGYVLLRDGESETRIGSIGGDADGFNELEESFFCKGERLVADADAAAREMAEILADLAS